MAATSLLCSYCEFTPAQVGSPYCCEACATLAHLRHSPVNVSPSQEDPGLIENYGQERGNFIEFECSVEPLACEACLQGLSRLPQSLPGLFDLQWNRDTSVLKFQFTRGAEFPTRFFEVLRGLGLNPRWNEPGQNLKQTSARRSQIMRVALTGALASNIMLFSIPIYTGVTGGLRIAFEFTQFFLFLPVFFWSAQPFFRTAWVSLRLRQLSVDLPLALAFILGSFFSTVSLFRGEGDLYFDSLAGFLFLILWSRMLLENSLAKHLKSPSLEQFLDQPLYRSSRAGQGEEIRLWRTLETGDFLYLDAGARLPVDARLLSSSAELDTAWLTGESRPTLILQGAEAQAGFRLLSQQGVFEVLRPTKDTDFAKLVGSLTRASEKIRPTQEARWGSLLVLTCFAIVALLFALAPSLGLNEILRRSLALLIVACPCAVSFAAPLARARSGQVAFMKGFWIRDPSIWGRLLSPKKIAFDKTGTLTGGQLVLVPNSPLIDTRWKQIILSLENGSRHPIAAALRKAWGAMPILDVQNLQESIGVGVQGEINGVHYEVRRSPSESENIKVALYQNRNQVIELEFEDASRSGLTKALDRLQKVVAVYLISGDAQNRVQTFAEKNRIPASRAWGDLKPDQKLAKVIEIEPDLYVGDGTNDLLAMKTTPVSIAMHGSSLEAQAAADILVLTPDFEQFEALFQIARETDWLVRRNLYIALFYNIAAGLLAVLGVIRPLEAALLMPVASLVLLASTIWGTHRLREWGAPK